MTSHTANPYQFHCHTMLQFCVIKQGTTWFTKKSPNFKVLKKVPPMEYTRCGII